MAFALLAPRPNSHPFQERQLSLKEPIKVGRAVAKAKASQSNGIFDCKVLSRNHAMLWYENGKFYLQDTKSSNGTYVNSVRLSRGSEESEPCEIKSGDILQFGVEVVENSKSVTHGCIVGLATLFHEDGTEATGDSEESQGVLSLLASDKAIQPNELWQLSQFLQDALHREQMLENKLATLQRMISNSHVASDDTFQGFIQEDKVLSRLETLENQLELVSKDMSDDETQSQLIAYQSERLQYESAAKETLQKILSEKIEVLQKCSDLERLLSNTEDECTNLRNTSEKSKEELSELIQKHKQIMDEVQQLKEDLEGSKVRYEAVQQQTLSEKQELKILLDDAEKRGSSLAVEVESLQAECDFTKQQLEAMKERLEAKQQKDEEDESLDSDDAEKNDLPFASDHATLEKDVKNKSALIRTLRAQIADLQAQLQDDKPEQTGTLEQSVERLEQDALQSKEISEEKEKILDDHRDQINMLEALMKSSLEKFSDWTKLSDVDCNDSFNCEINTIPTNNVEDCLDNQRNAIHACCSFLSTLQSYFEELTSKLPIERELSQNSTDESIKAQLTDAHTELEEVRKQILFLGDRLLEEQEINKRSKEIAATLQYQLYEAQHHMNLEKLDKSMSYATLESARKLADEMKQQASNNAKAAGQERVENKSLQEENESLHMKISRLQNEYKLLKQENQLLLKTNSSPRKTQSLLEPMKESSTSVDPITANSSSDISSTPSELSNEELQEQLKLANQSLDELTLERSEDAERFSQRQTQLMNFIFTLFLVILIFFALVMLGLIDVTPGTLPLLDEHTWNELLEHLF